MIIAIHPPDAAGPLRIGATGQDTVDTLRQLGDPQMLCRSPDSHPGWGVHRASGLFISVSLDADDRVEAIEFGRGGDTVTYNGLDVFATPAADLVTQLRRTTTVHEEDGHTFTAPELLLTFWRAITPEDPDDENGGYFEGSVLARPPV
jgi:hypothetical protein